MATITNRSPYLVKCPGTKDQRFAKKSDAEKYLASLANKKATLKQLKTNFQVQIRLKDKDGNTVSSSKSFSNEEDANKYADQEDRRLTKHRSKFGSFDMTYETAQLLPCLNRVVDEYYKDKPSQREHRLRVPVIAKFFGETTLIKDITPAQIKAFRDGMKASGYAPSTIRNFFSLINALYKHGRSEWLMTDLVNPADHIRLEKATNKIQRYWKNQNEKERLFTAIEKYAPWLKPIVELSLELSFRRGDLLPLTIRGRDAEKRKNDGLLWQGVDFEKKTIRLFKEKNDWKKNLNREQKGRILPMTNRVYEILFEIWEREGRPKEGRVFNRSGNSATHAMKRCCEKAGIENFGLHSCRKVATVNISKFAGNAIVLSRFTGHKSLDILASTYFDLPVEEMALVAEQMSISDYRLKALLAIEKMVGKQSTIDFLNFVRSIEVEHRTTIIDDLKKATLEPIKPAVKLVINK